MSHDDTLTQVDALIAEEKYEEALTIMRQEMRRYPREDTLNIIRSPEFLAWAKKTDVRGPFVTYALKHRSNKP